MKKLATLLAVGSLAIAAPVFACPNMDHETKTADKPKDSNGKDSSGTTAKAKDAPKEQPKPADTAKAKEAPAPAKEQPKKSGDKVSIK
jgi:hypothetical protein